MFSFFAFLVIVEVVHFHFWWPWLVLDDVLFAMLFAMVIIHFSPKSWLVFFIVGLIWYKVDFAVIGLLDIFFWFVFLSSFVDWFLFSRSAWLSVPEGICNGSEVIIINEAVVWLLLVFLLHQVDCLYCWVLSVQFFVGIFPFLLRFRFGGRDRLFFSCLVALFLDCLGHCWLVVKVVGECCFFSLSDWGFTFRFVEWVLVGCFDFINSFVDSVSFFVRDSFGNGRFSFDFNLFFAALIFD